VILLSRIKKISGLILNPFEPSNHEEKVIPMRTYPIWLAVAILALTGLAQSQEITDIYSNIESADVTVSGDVAQDLLHLELLFGDQVLQTRQFSLDGPGTWIGTWDSFEAEKGSYQVCATLLKDGKKQSERFYRFLYAGQTPVRFDVRDFNADSNGIHLSILSLDPTIVDIYYMLITGNKAIYISRDLSVPISSGISLQLDRPWHQILEDGKAYSGRVKIIEPSHNQTRAYLRSFVARDDAIITETYEDETGASATVLGNSRVPFQGSLRFTLSQNSTVLQIVEKKTPVLLTDKDETVEISWNKTLDPGIYNLNVVLLGNSGEVRDVKESIIEAKPLPKPANTTTTQKTSPLSLEIGIASLLIAAFLRRHKIS
jgi:hypothetical protein